MTKRCAIYTRVSSEQQTTDSQETELRQFAVRRGFKVVGVFSDRGISGARESRPELNRLLAACRKRQVDVVLCWKFDRFARSVRQLVMSLAEFKTLGIDFCSLTEQIDTTTPMGTLVFHVLGAVAELERSLISERTVAGLKQARRRGKRIGRPPAVVGPELAQQMRVDRTQRKLSLRGIAKKHGVTLWRVQKLLGGVSASV